MTLDEAASTPRAGWSQTDEQAHAEGVGTRKRAVNAGTRVGRKGAVVRGSYTGGRGLKTREGGTNTKGVNRQRTSEEGVGKGQTDRSVEGEMDGQGLWRREAAQPHGESHDKRIDLRDWSDRKRTDGPGGAKGTNGRDGFRCIPRTMDGQK